MSSGLHGQGERLIFLSAHRCPEVDVLPHHASVTQIPPPCSSVPAEDGSPFTCAGACETNYMNALPTAHSNTEEEEDRSVSDWSEEDLSLHFSPSVILPSDDEPSDPESGFECIDISVDGGVEGEGLKMVPKRQIQLKKKKDTKYAERTQVKLNHGPAECGGANSEMFCPAVHHGPDLLLRQHSMPASLLSLEGGDNNSYGVCRGPAAGVLSGSGVVGKTRQRLQKSFSLDETKTKMASCIITSVLSKKMQVEQNTSKTVSSYRNRMTASSAVPTTELRQGKEGGEGGPGVSSGPVTGVFKAPVHLVRDVRSLIKNNYRPSFSANTPHNNKPTCLNLIGQDESPPPTYQQAMGVKGHRDTNRSVQVLGHNSKGCNVKAKNSLSQSQDRNHSEQLRHPITMQRRGSEPTIIKNKYDNVALAPPTNQDLSELSPLERARERRNEIEAAPPPSPHLCPQVTQSSVPTQDKSSAPSSPKQVLQPWFYPGLPMYPPTQAPAIPVYPPPLQPHMGTFGVVNCPLSIIQTHLQPPLHGPTHLIRSKETSLPENPPDHSKILHPDRAGSSKEQGQEDPPVKATETKRFLQVQQQPFLSGFQGFLPAQTGSDFIVGVTGSPSATGAVLSGPTPCQVLFDPRSGQGYFMTTPSVQQRKLLLDPVTGQYVQVFLPEISSASNSSLFSVPTLNSTPIRIDPTPAVMMHLQPTVPVSSLYTHLPLPSHMPSANSTHTGT